jgi:hypothetical protein
MIGGEVAHVLVEGVGKVFGVGFMESVLHPLHTPNQGLKIVVRDIFMSLVRLLRGAAPSRFRLPPHLLSLLLRMDVLVPMGITILEVVLHQCVLIGGQGQVLLPLHSKSIGKTKVILLARTVNFSIKGALLLKRFKHYTQPLHN